MRQVFLLQNVFIVAIMLLKFICVYILVALVILALLVSSSSS